MKAYFIGGLGCNVSILKTFRLFAFSSCLSDMYDSKLKERLIFITGFERLVCSTSWYGRWYFVNCPSLGADLAVYLTSVYDNIMHLVLLDGGYIDMDKICPLNVEIEDALNYLQTNNYRNLEGAIIAEKQNATVWSENIERAVKKSFVFDEVQRYWHLNLSEILLTRLLTIETTNYGKLSLLQNRNVILFIPRVNQKWRPSGNRMLWKIFWFYRYSRSVWLWSPPIYRKPKEIAALLRDKIDTNRLFDKKENMVSLFQMGFNKIVSKLIRIYRI